MPKLDEATYRRRGRHDGNQGRTQSLGKLHEDDRYCDLRFTPFAAISDPQYQTLGLFKNLDCATGFKGVNCWARLFRSADIPKTCSESLAPHAITHAN